MSDCRPYQVSVPSVSIAMDWCFPEQGVYMNVLINLPLCPVCWSFVIHFTVYFWEVFHLPSFEVFCVCPPILYSRRVENFKLLCFQLAHCQFPECMEFFFNVGPCWREQSTAERAVSTVPVRGRQLYGKQLGDLKQNILNAHCEWVCTVC